MLLLFTSIIMLIVLAFAIIFQVIEPILFDKPIFPMFRKRKFVGSIIATKKSNIDLAEEVEDLAALVKLTKERNLLEKKLQQIDVSILKYDASQIKTPDNSEK